MGGLAMRGAGIRASSACSRFESLLTLTKSANRPAYVMAIAVGRPSCAEDDQTRDYENLSQKPSVGRNDGDRAALMWLD